MFHSVYCSRLNDVCLRQVVFYDSLSRNQGSAVVHYVFGVVCGRISMFMEQHFERILQKRIDRLYGRQDQKK